MDHLGMIGNERFMVGAVASCLRVGNACKIKSITDIPNVTASLPHRAKG